MVGYYLTIVKYWFLIVIIRDPKRLYAMQRMKDGRYFIDLPKEMKKVILKLKNSLNVVRFAFNNADLLLEVGRLGGVSMVYSLQLGKLAEVKRYRVL